VKRLFPFILIAVVGLLTVGIATAVYRIKTRPVVLTVHKPTPPPVATNAEAAASPAAEKEEEDPSVHVRGPKNAPLTLEIYGDFQCPPCGVASKAIDELQQQQFAGKMRVVYHEFPLSMHEHAFEAAMAAEAAGLQGKFWEMHDALYDNQPVWSKIRDVTVFFESYAQNIGLDLDRFRADRQSSAMRGRVLDDGNAGLERGVRNTPTIFLNGNLVKNVFTKDKLQEAIEAALAPKKSS
jgi:protein-disulfide isomerase